VCVTRQRRTVHGPRPFLVLFPNSHIPMVSRRCRLAWNGRMVWGSPGPLCPFVSFFSLPLASVRCLFCKQQQSNSKCNYNATSTHFLHSLCAELRVWSHAKLVWQMLLEVSRPRPLVLFFRNPGSFIILSLSEHCVAAVKRSIGAFSPRSPTFLFSFRQSRIS